MRRLRVLALIALAACANGDRSGTRAGAETAMNGIAESYVKLVLAVGVHDPDSVDAYYGPAEWREAADSAAESLDAIAAGIEPLVDTIATNEVPAGDSLLVLRRDYLQKQLQAVHARVRQLQGVQMTFDEESRALYDAVAPTHDEAHFDSILAQLEPLLAGEGTIAERSARYHESFVIPPERLDTVFQAAIAEARRRTAARITLPSDETFTLEYVTNQPWSGYNWYQGSARSLIQINTDLPITIDRAIDLAAHEGYPGHHVYNVLLERHLVRDRGWVEYSVYPLFSPQSLIAEGSANFGIRVAFPGEERTAFERDVLYPLAGLDASRAEEYAAVLSLEEELSYAGNEAARRYLVGAIDSFAAAAWLSQYALYPPERARQRVRFIERYRSYVINYNLGQDLVRRWVERQGGTPDAPEQRWNAFAALLSSPRLPSGLQN
jgi:hypothetical protein